MMMSSSSVAVAVAYSSGGSIPRSVHPSNNNNGTTTSYSHLKFISNNSYSTTYAAAAKFDKFQPNFEDDPPIPIPMPMIIQDTQDEDDSCLPSDLEGAVRQSGQASAEFVSSGGTRAIVELLIPQLQFLDDEGAQAELWELSKLFLETLIEETGGQRVKAIFPDAGAAALLKYQWKDATFGFASLGDRKPVSSEDEIVVMVVPDYQMLEYVEKIASDLSDDPPRPLIMWNPRLFSEDVGIGINVRRLRRDFLSPDVKDLLTKQIIGRGHVLGGCRLWKVFYDDKERPNRYLLAKEQIRRPDIEDLEIIFGGQGKSEEEKGKTSLVDQASALIKSLHRIMARLE
ncbi:hypothetical protein BUALT_Bualt01G0142800 [Buddleja alternifolia]|uniref:DUF1995 domain-containing protein n=1 Tax=Buddleja alternifolia TaxID=168488 RepID=A0AAV6Y9E1_9LAMI|nr:hypothetical protein BUALT_Bualt01G0142800 [Buddleja alternifolia]